MESKIKAGELRINNWVSGTKNYAKFPMPLKVVEISEEKIKVRLGDDNQDIGCCYGIPLDEHVFLKCGAYQLPYFTVMNSFYLDLGRNRELSIGSVGTPNLMVFIQEIEKDENGKAIKVCDLVCIHNFDYDGKLYLHQLQNMYYWLSGGKELEFKV